MRVFLSAVLVGSTFVLAACSGAPDVTLRRSSDSVEGTPAAKSGGNKTNPGGSSSPTPATDSPAPATPAPDSSPATPDTGSKPQPTPTPATPAPGSCGNPKCIAGGGFAGCKATDGAGATVTMGCQDGQCACFVGNQTTSTFDGDANSSAEAAQLFLTNCDCN